MFNFKRVQKEEENVPFIFANDTTFVAVGKVSLSCYKMVSHFCPENVGVF